MKFTNLSSMMDLELAIGFRGLGLPVLFAGLDEAGERQIGRQRRRARGLVGRRDGDAVSARDGIRLGRDGSGGAAGLARWKVRRWRHGARRFCIGSRGAGEEPKKKGQQCLMAVDGWIKIQRIKAVYGRKIWIRWLASPHRNRNLT